MLSSRIEQLERMLMERLASTGTPGVGAVFAEPSAVAEQECRAGPTSEVSQPASDATEKVAQAIDAQLRDSPAIRTMNLTVANTVAVISVGSQHVMLHRKRLGQSILQKTSNPTDSFMCIF